MKPLCFVLMPFGRKADERGRLTDFDAVYTRIIAPGILAAEIEPIRADEEQVGGSIHKPMFERLLLCEYAVADLTGANPNVFYELGVRHAIRPRSTLLLFAAGTLLPFDLAPLRGMPYAIDAAGQPAEPERDAAAIAVRLRAARQDASDDSPVFQLVEGMPRIDVDHAKTDVFRDRTQYSQRFKDRLAEARRQGVDAVRAVAGDGALSNLLEVELGIVVDLFLSFRAVKAYAEMADLFQRMPAPLQHARMIQEQLGFALNRLGRHEEAERTLKAVIEQYGASSETNGLLGRVCKDRWEAAKAAGHGLAARGLLRQAIAAYLAGFEADWRDPYPGINAVTLMELAEPPDARRLSLLPVVRYAAERRASSNGDYWDHATLLELAVLARDVDAAHDAAAAAAAAAREGWELETTARNLRLIRETRAARQEDAAWVGDIEDELVRTAGTVTTRK